MYLLAQPLISRSKGPDIFISRHLMPNDPSQRPYIPVRLPGKLTNGDLVVRETPLGFPFPKIPVQEIPLLLQLLLRHLNHHLLEIIVILQRTLKIFVIYD